MIEIDGEPSQSDRPQTKAEITQGDVVKILQQQKIDNDADEPGGHDVGANFGPEGDQQSGYDFDSADDFHKCAGAAKEITQWRPEILCPISELHQKLVAT